MNAYLCSEIKLKIMRQIAAKLFNEIMVRRTGCIDLILQTLEDVAVDFAWEILEAFKCGSGTTRSNLKLSFDDYSKKRPILQYPTYKTQVEIAKERVKLKREYDDKKYGYMARPGISPHTAHDTRHYTAQDIHDRAQREKKKSDQRVIWYMSPEDAEYLWACMPTWIKEVPGPEHAYDPTYFGTLTREGDLKVQKEVKRILNR